VNSALQLNHQHAFFTISELLEIGDIHASLNKSPAAQRRSSINARAIFYKLDIRRTQTVESIKRPARRVHGRIREGQQYTERSDTCNRAYTTCEQAECSRRGCAQGHSLLKEAHPYYNQDVVVIGGKNSAAICRLELWWTGARVTRSTAMRIWPRR